MTKDKVFKRGTLIKLKDSISTFYFKEYSNDLGIVLKFVPNTKSYVIYWFINGEMYILREMVEEVNLYENTNSSSTS